MDRRVLSVLAAGLALRVLLCDTALADVLVRRPELSSPITSFRSLREGVFLARRGVDPYDGGVFVHSPLYLYLIRHVPLDASLWALADLVGALALMRISEAVAMSGPGFGSGSGCSSGAGAGAGAGVASMKEKEKRRDPRPHARAALVVALYLFNPYVLLSTLARSCTSLENALLLVSIACVARGRGLGSALLGGASLALVSHTSLYPVLLLPPALVARRGIFVPFVLVFGAVAWVNTAMYGSAWLASWRVILTVSDLTPNVGMWWYFFTEMFDHFRAFFLGVFQLHTLIYVLPITLRLRAQPLLAILVLVGVIATWKSYPTLGDLGAWAGLLACFPEVVAELRHPLFSTTVYLYTLILLPLLHSLWLLTGTGNANFFYAATMVHGLNSCLAIVDVLTAGMRLGVMAGVRAGAGGDGDGAKTWPDNWIAVQFTGIA